jgi:hypothetical protein
MAAIISSTYTKTGAVFATGQEAYDNKNSLYPTELTDSVHASNDAQLANGILTQPLDLVWDAGTFTLKVEKHVYDTTAYYETRTFDGSACVSYSNTAGWTFDGDIVIPIVV